MTRACLFLSWINPSSAGAAIVQCASCDEPVEVLWCSIHRRVPGASATSSQLQAAWRPGAGGCQAVGTLRDLGAGVKDDVVQLALRGASQGPSRSLEQPPDIERVDPSGPEDVSFAGAFREFHRRARHLDEIICPPRWRPRPCMAGNQGARTFPQLLPARGILGLLPFERMPTRPSWSPSCASGPSSPTCSSELTANGPSMFHALQHGFAGGLRMKRKRPWGNRMKNPFRGVEVKH